MPLNITADTPRNARTIAGVLVQVPAPYAEGHVVSAGEAAMLNQTLAENFSNNLRKRVAEYQDGDTTREATPEEAQTIVDEYAGVYEPGVRRAGGGGGRRTLDPVEKEMRVMARAALDDLLKKQGIKRKDVEYDDLLEQVLADHEATLRPKAEKIVKQRGSSDLELGADLVAAQG
jgi:hypothetical protein